MKLISQRCAAAAAEPVERTEQMPDWLTSLTLRDWTYIALGWQTGMTVGSLVYSALAIRLTLRLDRERDAFASSTNTTESGLEGAAESTRGESGRSMKLP